MKARKETMNQYSKWLSLASLSLLSAAALQAVASPEVKAEANPVSASSGWVEEGQSFKTVDQAMNYGSQHADWSKYKQYRVNYAGPNRYVLKWELRNPQAGQTLAGSDSQASQSNEQTKPSLTKGSPAGSSTASGSHTVQSGDSL
ncbi:hypothetical protein QP389_09440, partial [Streptococcus mitis]|nr:hypothetical protein [Streptococcus mitis]